MAALLERYGHAAVVQALREETDALRRRLASAAGACRVHASGLSRRRRADEAAALIEAGLEPRLARPVPRRRSGPSSTPPASSSTRTSAARRSPRRALEQRRGRRRGATRPSSTTWRAGGRGHRDEHAEQLLCRLTGAEAAVVVNNNAAATLLMLAALAAGREVIVSRGELVEIGGGFRVPDVMAQSGAVLREVGTTNRTRAADYDRRSSDDGPRSSCACTRRTSASRGSPSSPSLEELVALGRRHGVPVAEDLGSGNSSADSCSRPIGRAALDECRGWSRCSRRADGPGQPRRRRRRRLRQRRQAARRAAGRHHPRPARASSPRSAATR